ncbi:hypothetical protein D3C80_2147830 [compost metagenome]
MLPVIFLRSVEMSTLRVSAAVPPIWNLTAPFSKLPAAFFSRDWPPKVVLSVMLVSSFASSPNSAFRAV